MTQEILSRLSKINDEERKILDGEEKVNKKTGQKNSMVKDITPTSLNDIEKQMTKRISTGFNELDRVLGGGLVKGSLTLLGGEPGIRKIHINITNL